MKNNLVSICIPTYNQTYLLKKTLESILTQTYTNYEVIISDDSTTDDVFNLIKKYDFKGKITYYKNNTPLGSPANWNNAINKAKGEYIKILHHDDWFSNPNSLAEFISSAEKNPDSDLFFSSAEVYDLKKDKNYLYISNRQGLCKIKKDPLLLMTGNIIGSPSVTFFKKNMLLFDENLKWLVDTDFYIRLIKNNSNFIFLKKPLIHISIGAEQQTTKECQNKEVEFREWFYVYKKYKTNKSFTFTEMLHLFKLVRRYKIRSIEEIKKITEILNEKTLVKIIKINNYI